MLKSKGEATMEEFTANIKLSPLALKLRTMRLNRGFSMDVVSIICKVSVDELCAWEIGKSEPSKEILERLISLYT